MQQNYVEGWRACYYTEFCPFPSKLLILGWYLKSEIGMFNMNPGDTMLLSWGP